MLFTKLIGDWLDEWLNNQDITSLKSIMTCFGIGCLDLMFALGPILFVWHIFYNLKKIFKS